jgi:hypothetical protein
MKTPDLVTALVMVVVLAILTVVVGGSEPRRLPRLAMSELRDSAVTAEAVQAGVPVNLALALSHVEDWSGDTMATSSVGALGVMQARPEYWDGKFVADCGDGPLTGLRRGACVGVRVLAQFHASCPSWGAAVRQYGVGPGRAGCAPGYGDAVFDKLVTR